MLCVIPVVFCIMKCPWPSIGHFERTLISLNWSTLECVCFILPDNLLATQRTRLVNGLKISRTDAGEELAYFVEVEML